MRMVLLFCVLLSLQVTAGVNNNKDLSKQFTVSLGSAQSSVGDRYFSRLNFSGMSGVVGLGYQWKKHNNWWDIAAASGVGILTTGDDLFQTTHTQFELRSSFNRTLVDYTPIRIALGGFISSQGVILNYDDYDNVSWFGAQELGAQLSLFHTRREKHHFSTMLALPFVVYVSHPPYAGFNEESDEKNGFENLFDGEFVSLSRFFQPRLNFSYCYQIGEKLALGAAYCGVYTKSTGIHEYKTINNKFEFTCTMYR